MRQVSLSSPQSLAEQLFQAPIRQHSWIQEQALHYAQLQLNVFPVPYQQKQGWTWRRLQYTQLPGSELYRFFDGQCNLAVMTGRTSGNLLVIECENAQALRYHLRQLEQQHIPRWAYRTGSAAGGGHIWLRLSESAAANSCNRTGYQIRGNRCYVLAPPSVHPETSQFYEWQIREGEEVPSASLAQLEWLDLRIARPEKPAPQPQPFAALSRRSRDYMMHGALEGERNNRLFSAACDLAGNGFDYETALALLMPISSQSGLGEREVRSTLRSAYAISRSPSKPRQPLSFELGEYIAARIDHLSWQGRSGQTDRAVLLSCCERAKRSIQGTFRASVREIADLARINKDTANRSLKRLVAQGYLERRGQDRSSGAGLFRFGQLLHKRLSEEVLRCTDTTSFPLGGRGSVPITQNLIDCDAAEYKALGKTAYYFYQQLVKLGGAVGVQQLQVQCQLSQSQIYRALKKLRQHGLVIQPRYGLWQAEVLPMEAVSIQVGTATGTLGSGEVRREAHRRQRSLQAARELLNSRSRWERDHQAQLIEKPLDVKLAEPEVLHQQDALVDFACQQLGASSVEVKQEDGRKAYNANMRQEIESGLEVDHALLRQYAATFITRWDRYALQRPDGRYVSIAQALEPSLLADHLVTGQVTLGAYALDEESYAKWICLDADTEAQWQALFSLAGRLYKEGIPSYPEVSRRGGHLWLFTEKLSGKEARQFAMQLLLQSQIEGVEIYPKQERLKTGPGSLVRLPLGIHRKTQKRYYFVDLEGKPLAPTIRQQIQLLSQPEQVPMAYIQSLLKEVAEPEEKPMVKPQYSPDSSLPLSEKLKAVTSVYDFVRHYVELSPGGTGYVGYCPFHEDTKPSFGVDPSGNFWHCWAGCGGGSIIDFWMQWRAKRGEDASFKATLHELALMLLS